MIPFTDRNIKRQFKKNLISLPKIKFNKKKSLLKTLIRLSVNKSLLLNIILIIILNIIKLNSLFIS